MGNLLDYLHEFASKTFSVAPFNEADNLAFSQLAYCDLSGAVPRFGSSERATVEQAWSSYAQSKDPDAISTGRLTRSELVFEAMAASTRFGSTELAWFDERRNQATHAQFAAFTALLPDGTAYVSFRGTDSYLSAWRENFMMSYMVVDAQANARRYLNAVSCLTAARLRVGGHSKGGNLAAFAAANCSPRVRQRIDEIWCNDSPGFVREVIDFAALDALAGRAHLFVPEFCIVAGIMEQSFEPSVVKSTGNRYLQHDLMTWQIAGGRLVRAEATDPACHRIGRIFHWLIYAHDRKQRIEIVNDLFDAIALAGITMVSDLFERNPSLLPRIAAQYRMCTSQTRKAVKGVLIPLAKEETGTAISEAFARITRRFASVSVPALIGRVIQPIPGSTRSDRLPEAVSARRSAA